MVDQGQRLPNRAPRPLGKRSTEDTEGRMTRGIGQGVVCGAHGSGWLGRGWGAVGACRDPVTWSFRLEGGSKPLDRRSKPVGIGTERRNIVRAIMNM